MLGMCYRHKGRYKAGVQQKEGEEPASCHVGMYMYNHTRLSHAAVG